MTPSVWPALPVDEWAATRDTLQLWTQVVGKVRLARTPVMSHWWNVPLYVTASGLTTSLIPGDGRSFEIDFDFVEHRLDIVVTDGSRRSIALEPKSTAVFYDEVMAALDELGLATPVWPVPVEIPDAIRFDARRGAHLVRPAQAQRFWLALVQMDRVFESSAAASSARSARCTCSGARSTSPSPASPAGRRRRTRAGAPNCGPHVMHEAYSHEVSSAGYWPGPDGEGVFYSYAYPEPPGFRDADLGVRRRPLRRAARRVRAPVHGRAHGRRPRRPSAAVPPGHLRGGGRPRRLGSCRARASGRRYWTTRAVTIPNIPSVDSTWLRMWQCHTHVPGEGRVEQHGVALAGRHQDGVGGVRAGRAARRPWRRRSARTRAGASGAPAGPR